MSKKIKLLFTTVILIGVFSLLFLLSFRKDIDKKCIVEKESMYRNVYLSKGTYNQLCNYKDTFIKDLIINDKYNLVNNIYLMSKIDKDFSLEVTKKYITKDFTRNLSSLELLQTYTFIERIYGYNEIQIKDNFGIELKHNYRFDKNLSLKKIFLGPNILEKDYDKERLEMEDLNLLEIVVNLDPDKVTGSFVISVGIENPYKSIVSKEGKEKFINIIKKVVEKETIQNGQFFYPALKFLDDNNKIDIDFFNKVVKKILLEKSKDNNPMTRYYDQFINTYIYIIKKYDKDFANTILKNFKEKTEK